jgi:branched-chain amino acid transport system permease protein
MGDAALADGGAADGAAPAGLIGRLWRPAANLALLPALVVFPLVFTNPAVTTDAVYALIFVAAAAAWNVFSGFTGYISLGHVVFFGSGVYFTAIATLDWGLTGSEVFWLLPLAGLVAALIAVPFGFLALRVRRHTFVVITIAVFFIFQLMAYNLGITGGSAGLLTPPINFATATFNNPFYYVALAIAVGTVTVSWLIRRSRYGLQLRAIRDDEDRARGLGVPAMRVKLGAFVFSAVPVAMVGGLWWYFTIIADPPDAFDPLRDLTIALMAFLGGLGTVYGPVLGALIIEPAQLYFFPQVGASYVFLIVYGALFLLVILGLPRGIIPTGAELLGRWQARRSQRRPTVAAAAGGTDAEVASMSGAAVRTGDSA